MKKYLELVFYLLTFQSTALIHGNSLGIKISSVFNICLFYMHFRQENALQSNMVIVRFSPKTVSPPQCHLTLPLPVCATVMSMHFFFHARAIEKLTYIRNVNSTVGRLVCI